jgi:hypothetical protein
MVSKKLDIPIEVTESSDPRSYRVNSDRLLATGFKPRYTVSDAIDEIIAAYQRGELKDEPKFHNLTWMMEKNFAGVAK